MTDINTSLEDAALIDPILREILSLVDAGNFDSATTLARQTYDIASRRAFRIGLLNQMDSKKQTETQLERAEGLKGVTFRAISGLDNYIRNQRFETTRKNSTAPNIVVQGDSWVSFPFVIQDLGQHLSKLFPTFCIGCPGDNVQDMGSAEKLDELLWSLDYTQADFLVLSGGGNEMIGEDFPKVLTDANPDTGINQAQLDRKKAEVIAGFDKIISAAVALKPNLKIFVHSYDKPHPRTGQAWLGQVLETAQVPQDKWHGVCGEIIDQFDQSLVALADRYENLHRVDLRGISNTTDPAWHDEIHLSSAGYGKAALKFKAAIQQVAS